MAVTPVRKFSPRETVVCPTSTPYVGDSVKWSRRDHPELHTPTSRARGRVGFSPTAQTVISNKQHEIILGRSMARILN